MAEQPTIRMWPGWPGSPSAPRRLHLQRGARILGRGPAWHRVGPGSAASLRRGGPGGGRGELPVRGPGIARPAGPGRQRAGPAARPGQEQPARRPDPAGAALRRRHRGRAGVPPSLPRRAGQLHHGPALRAAGLALHGAWDALRHPDVQPQLLRHPGPHSRL